MRWPLRGVRPARRLILRPRLLARLVQF
jgi:hypothetical protein